MPKPPVGDIAFTLRKIAGLDAAIDEGLFPELSPDLVEAVLDEAARFAADRMAPLDRIGDEEGARFEKGGVTMPAGWKEAMPSSTRPCTFSTSRSMPGPAFTSP